MKKNQISYFDRCYFDFEKIEAELQRQSNAHLEALFSGKSEGSYFELTSVKGRASLRIEFTGHSDVSIDLERLIDEEIKYASGRDDPIAEMDVTLKALRRLVNKLESAMKRKAA